MDDMRSRVIKALRGSKRGLSAKELAKRISAGKRDKDALCEALKALEGEYSLIIRDGRYVSAEALGLAGAEIVKVTGSFGFAKPLDGGQDVFIPGRLLMGAMPGDSVLIRVTRGLKGLPEGEVNAVVKAANKPFSGIADIGPDGCFVVPDKFARFPIRLDGPSSAKVKRGDKVLAVMARRGERHSRHVARVLEVFGSSDSARACCGAILAENGITADFPPEAAEQAAAIASGEGIHPREIAARKDLREKIIFTIDGADTKDIDDAISLERHENGWELGVHIADVSYYVTHKSPLDIEALARGTSVYYADFVVPMLPKELSNGICSLNPGEDRLAFSAFIRLDGNAAAISYSFEKTVIRSRIKGVYGEINSLLAGNAPAEIEEKYAEVKGMLDDMRRLAGLLAEKRLARGGMELDIAESRISIGEDGRADGIMPRTRGISERMIEDFMLTANEAAASYAISLGIPCVYRVHEDPSPDKLGSLYETLDSLGISHGGGIAAAIENAEELGLGGVVNSLVLRSMSKAKYSPENTGHFGLALKNYTHFTSPIRRYPDLLVHRVLSARVTGMRPDNIEKRFRAFSSEAAMLSTGREIAAVAAERACEDCYKAEYMERFIGDEFNGIISSVTAFGAYVRLENTVEGLVRLSGLGEGQWELDGLISLVEKHSGKRFRLGDNVKIKILSANISAGNIDMLFV